MRPGRVRQRGPPAGNGMGERATGETLGNRSNADLGLRIRFATTALGSLAKAENRTLAIPDCGDDQARNAAVEVEDLTGEADGVVQKGILRKSGSRHKKGGRGGGENVSH